MYGYTANDPVNNTDPSGRVLLPLDLRDPGDPPKPTHTISISFKNPFSAPQDAEIEDSVGLLGDVSEGSTQTILNALDGKEAGVVKRIGASMSLVTEGVEAGRDIANGEPVSTAVGEMTAEIGIASVAGGGTRAAVAGACAASGGCGVAATIAAGVATIIGSFVEVDIEPIPADRQE